MVLNSRFPMQIWWGDDLVQMYNDAYRPIARGKHPEALGAKGSEIWHEVWDLLSPMVEQVMIKGEATWWENYRFYIENDGMLEESYFTFSHSPIYIHDGTKIGGILTTVNETTKKVINERRLNILRDLAVRSIGNRSEGEVYRNILNVLSAYELDVPFALLFKYNPKTEAFHLSGATGLMRYEGPLKDPEKWQLQEALHSGKVLKVNVSSDIFGLTPKNELGVGVKHAVILPLIQPQFELKVALVLGLSPHRIQDESRRQFAMTLLEQLSTVIASVKSIEIERETSKSHT
jgi:hypothetical protein